MSENLPTPETGWIIAIESILSVLYLSLVKNTNPCIVVGKIPHPIAWSWDNKNALRFAREEDARFFLECFELQGCRVEKYTEEANNDD